MIDADIVKSTITSTDDGNGNYTNPVIFADVPDIDFIRVDDAYYMVSTTMHLSPGCPVMKSYDLVNWEIVNYVYNYRCCRQRSNKADNFFHFFHFTFTRISL